MSLTIENVTAWLKGEDDLSDLLYHEIRHKVNTWRGGAVGKNGTPLPHLTDTEREDLSHELWIRLTRGRNRTRPLTFDSLNHFFGWVWETASYMKVDLLRMRGYEVELSEQFQLEEPENQLPTNALPSDGSELSSPQEHVIAVGQILSITESEDLTPNEQEVLRVDLLIEWRSTEELPVPDRNEKRHRANAVIGPDENRVQRHRSEGSKKMRQLLAERFGSDCPGLRMATEVWRPNNRRGDNRYE